MTDPQPSTRTRSDSLRSALRAFTPRARTRPSSTPTTDAGQQQAPPQKDPGAAPPRHRAATRDATSAPAESVRVSDHPATGRSRVFLVERGLEQDGYGALQALVADYMHESVRRDEPAILVNLDQLAAGL